MIFDILTAIWAMRVALSREIASNMRAITIDLDPEKKMLTMYFYCEGPITEEIEDIASCVECEASAKFPTEYRSNENLVIRMDPPMPIPIKGRLIHLRYEEKQQPIPDPLRGINLKSESDDFNAPIYAMSGLLGNVLPELRAVLVEMNSSENWFAIYFYYDGEISVLAKKLAARTVERIRTYLPSDFRIDQFMRRVDYPNEIRYSISGAYIRKEKNISVLWVRDLPEKVFP